MIGWGQRWLLGSLLGALLLAATSAAAQPVIPPGQEARVLELFVPHGFGGEPVDGWRLDEVTIERSFIQATIAGASDRRATLRLHHPSVFADGERTPSFALERIGESAAALDPWVAAIRSNDDGDFWDDLPAFRLDRHPTSSADHRVGGRSSSSIDFATAGALGGALLVVLLLVLWERRRFGVDEVVRAPEPVSSVRSRLALSLAAVGMAALACWLTAGAPPLHSDTNRDLLLARDCLESGICLGPRTSFGGLEQHGGWTRLLAALRALGLAPVGVHRVLIAANALGAGLLCFVASRRLSPPLALASTFVAFSWLLWAASFPTLWNPTLSPLAYALLFAGALERRWAVAGVLGGLGAVGAVETHVAGIVALAALVLALRALGDRPGRAVALALVIFLGFEAAVSAQALATNLASPVAQRIVLPGIVVGLGLTWFVGGLVRRRVPGSWREIVILALCALGTTGPPVLAALAAGHFLTARYFAVALVPLVALGAAALAFAIDRKRGAARWLASLVALGAVALSAQPWIEVANDDRWDLAEVAVIADALDAAEDYPRVRLMLRGPLSGLLGEGLAAWAEDARFDPPMDAPTIRVVRVDDPSTLPDGWRAVPLPGGAVAGVSELRSWLHPERAEVCLSTEGPPVCLTLTPTMWRSFGGERSSYERLASGILPAAERLRDRVTADGWEHPTLFVRIPVVTDESDGERSLQLFDDVGGDGGWRVARVEGVAHRGEIGGQRVVLASGGEGTLTLEYTEPVAHYVPSLVLDALELGPTERELRDVICAEFSGCE